jgi:hypothetical protein
MQQKLQFKPATFKDTFKTGFHGYLNISYQELVDKLGEPHDRTKEGEWQSLDQKVRVEWAFKSKNKKYGTVLTIYDYKEYRPITEVNQWHVGIKGDAHQVDLLFKERNLHPEMFEIRKKYR